MILCKLEANIPILQHKEYSFISLISQLQKNELWVIMDQVLQVVRLREYCYLALMETNKGISKSILIWLIWFLFQKLRVLRTSSESSCYLSKQSILRQLNNQWNMMEFIFQICTIYNIQHWCLIFSLFIGFKTSKFIYFHGEFIVSNMSLRSIKEWFCLFLLTFYWAAVCHKWHFDRVYWFPWKL